jgi:hypothetical protein
VAAVEDDEEREASKRQLLENSTDVSWTQSRSIGPFVQTYIKTVQVLYRAPFDRSVL